MCSFGLSFYIHFIKGGGGGAGGWGLHASHRALRGNYIINARPPAITALDSRSREARKSASECFIVHQQPISQRIFFYSSASSVPVIFNVFYHQSMLIRRRRSRQSYRTRKDNKRKSYQLFWHIYLLEKHQKENVQSTRINLDRES